MYAYSMGPSMGSGVSQLPLPILSPRVLAGLLGTMGVCWLVIRYIRRFHDPLDYRAWDVKYQPVLSILYFKNMRAFDPLSYDDLVHAMREFSRLYQSTFLVEVQPAEVIRDMAKQRRLVHRHAHVLRGYLPNTLRLEKRLLLGLEHTDGAMEYALADVARRYPEVRLLYGAGKVDRQVRAADEAWS